MSFFFAVVVMGILSEINIDSALMCIYRWFMHLQWFEWMDGWMDGCTHFYPNFHPSYWPCHIQYNFFCFNGESLEDPSLELQMSKHHSTLGMHLLTLRMARYEGITPHLHFLPTYLPTYLEHLPTHLGITKVMWGFDIHLKLKHPPSLPYIQFNTLVG